MGFDERDIRRGGFGLDDDGLKLGERGAVSQLVFQIVERKPETIGNRGKITIDRGHVVAEKDDAE